MNSISILYPVIALVLWTLLICYYLGYKRFKAGYNNLVKLSDFTYGESKTVPDNLKLPNQNFINLFEVPVLFYVACVVSYITQSVDTLLIYLAWMYVITRVLHTLIHLSYNHVLHRFVIFALGCLIITVMWLAILISLISRPLA